MIDTHCDKVCFFVIDIKAKRNFNVDELKQFIAWFWPQPITCRRLCVESG